MCLYPCEFHRRSLLARFAASPDGTLKFYKMLTASDDFLGTPHMLRRLVLDDQGYFVSDAWRITKWICKILTPPRISHGIHVYLNLDDAIRHCNSYHRIATVTAHKRDLIDAGDFTGCVSAAFTKIRFEFADSDNQKISVIDQNKNPEIIRI